MNTLSLLYKNSMGIIIRDQDLHFKSCHRYLHYISIHLSKTLVSYTCVDFVMFYFIDICIIEVFSIYFYSSPGPVLRAEVGDTLQVTFLNKADRNFSIQSHGLQYTKSFEGAQYYDGEKAMI